MLTLAQVSSPSAPSTLSCTTSLPASGATRQASHCPSHMSTFASLSMALYLLVLLLLLLLDRQWYSKTSDNCVCIRQYLRFTFASTLIQTAIRNAEYHQNVLFLTVLSSSAVTEGLIFCCGRARAGVYDLLHSVHSVPHPADRDSLHHRSADILPAGSGGPQVVVALLHVWRLNR